MSKPTDPSVPGDQCSARVLNEQVRADHEFLLQLRADSAVSWLDHRDSQRAELQAVLPVPEDAVLHDPGVWAYYPWRHAAVGVLGPAAFRLLRLDRNRHKITHEEQAQLGQLRIGVVGLSVGHAIAHTLALEGLCCELRLADPDTLDLSNLNRVPATVFDLGVNKSVVAARRIAELDPYLPVSVQRDGLTPETIAEFLDGVDVVIEECDSLDMKLLLRQEARARKLPVLMETSDRGLLDVERFDLEPDRPIFHGLLGDLDASALAGLSASDRVPHLLRLLDASALSSRIAASLVEVGRSISTWPQLGGDIALGAASVAAAVRRLGLGEHLPSGRIRIDLGEHLDDLRSPQGRSHSPPAHSHSPPGQSHSPPGSQPAPAAGGAAEAVLQAIRAAPSGGNIQPWSVSADAEAVRIYLAPERTTTMDVEHRGSYVAIGAALHNARVAASRAQALGPAALFPDGPTANLVATLQLRDDSDADLSGQHEVMARRHTNRKLGSPRELTSTIENTLRTAAEREGGTLHLVTDRVQMQQAGEVAGAADRIRYLTPALHAEMIAELRWPGLDSLEVGIDVQTLELDEASLATLAIARRPDVMAHLAAWDRGAALGADAEARIASSSALAVVTVPGCTPRDFVHGGSAVESVWIAAQQCALSVQPTSPVFLYGLSPADLATLSPRYSAELACLQTSFRQLVGIGDGQSIALIMRLSHAAPPSTYSRRLPLAAIAWAGDATLEQQPGHQVRAHG